MNLNSLLALFGDGAAGFTTRIRATKSGAQTLTAATFEKVEYDSEDYDTDEDYDADTSYEFTAPANGYYFAHAMVRVLAMDANATMFVNFVKNGSTDISSRDDRNSHSGAAALSVELSDVIFLSKDETLEVQCRQNSALDKSVSQDGTLTFFSVHRLS